MVLYRSYIYESLPKPNFIMNFKCLNKLYSCTFWTFRSSVPNEEHKFEVGLLTSFHRYHTETRKKDSVYSKIKKLFVTISFLVAENMPSSPLSYFHIRMNIYTFFYFGHDRLASLLWLCCLYIHCFCGLALCVFALWLLMQHTKELCADIVTHCMAVVWINR